MTACRVVDETIRGADIIYGSLNLRIPFAGDHMIKNALTAVTAVRECGLNVSGEAIEQGMKNAVMPARMELIGENIILDGGHNEGCASALKAFWSASQAADALPCARSWATRTATHICA